LVGVVISGAPVGAEMGAALAAFFAGPIAASVTDRRLDHIVHRLMIGEIPA
jgi:hypothetical protein